MFGSFRKYSPCIIEVKCSQVLVDEVRRLGGWPFFYKTGHSLIKAKMKEAGAVFTGEMSGRSFSLMNITVLTMPFMLQVGFRVFSLIPGNLFLSY